MNNMQKSVVFTHRIRHSTPSIGTEIAVVAAGAVDAAHADMVVDGRHVPAVELLRILLPMPKTLVRNIRWSHGGEG